MIPPILNPKKLLISKHDKFSRPNSGVCQQIEFLSSAYIPKTLSFTVNDYILALQVAYNLRYQHDWSDIFVHVKSTIPPFNNLTVPLISGLPPKRIYIHPDEQVELLKFARDKSSKNHIKSKNSIDDNPSADIITEDLPPVREWVLPTHLRKSWSLAELSNVFNSISLKPPTTPHDSVNGIHIYAELSSTPNNSSFSFDNINPIINKSFELSDKWRTKKRALMSILDDDGTIVYYFVHEGIVKPRQN